MSIKYESCPTCGQKMLIMVSGSCPLCGAHIREPEDAVVERKVKIGDKVSVVKKRQGPPANADSICPFCKRQTADAITGTWIIARVADKSFAGNAQAGELTTRYEKVGQFDAALCRSCSKAKRDYRKRLSHRMRVTSMVFFVFGGAGLLLHLITREEGDAMMIFGLVACAIGFFSWLLSLICPTGDVIDEAFLQESASLYVKQYWPSQWHPSMHLIGSTLLQAEQKVGDWMLFSPPKWSESVVKSLANN